MPSLREYATFFREFRSRFETTGAIAPSSRFLAAALLRPLKRRVDDRPVRILEIGPGTGAVTDWLVRQGQPGDILDLVELNETFADVLRKKFEQDPTYRHIAERSQVHVVPLQEFEAEEPYDFIISGLPLNNFPASLVDEVFQAYFRLLSPGGTLSYFEYMYVRSIRKRVGAKQARERLGLIDATMSQFTQRFRVRRDWIFVNLPPAWVQHLRKSEEHDSSGDSRN